MFSLLRIELRDLSYHTNAVIQGLLLSITLLFYFYSCRTFSGKVSLDRMTEFLHKTELLQSFADKPPQGDIPITTECDDLGFNNATFSWSKAHGHDGTLTPSQRTFSLHISGKQLFKRDCINLIIGPT